MDAAAMADLAGRMHERLLAGARAGPPTIRKRQRRDWQVAAVVKNIGINSASPEYIASAAASRAVERARRRLADIERRGGLYQAVGLVDAALRLAAVADAIRAEVLA